MNKNISIWRGSQEPPTKYHLWIDEKNNVNLWDGTDWKTVADGENYADVVEHLESFPKIDIVNEIPNGSDFKNGDFLLYKLGKDITISSPECYDFGKNTSFTIREGELCLIGKIKHTPTSLLAEYPKFSDKYKYKIRFDSNTSYYFGGIENAGEPVLTTTTQPLTYSLIGSADKCIIKCGNYYAFISGERLCLTTNVSNATYFVLNEFEPNKFELLNYNSLSSALNAYQGLGTAGDYSDDIRWYNAGRPGNIILFLPQEHELIIKKVISTQEATTSYSGLMSKEDKAKLNNIAYNANNYSLPAASSTQRGGIKIGYSSSTANDRAVMLSNEKAYVNIPDATTSQAGLMTSSDKEKLNNIVEVKWSILKRNITGDVVYRTTDGVIKSIQPSKWNSNLGQPIGIVVIPELELEKNSLFLCLDYYEGSITYRDSYSDLSDVAIITSYASGEFSTSNPEIINTMIDIELSIQRPVYCYGAQTLLDSLANIDLTTLNNTLTILGKQTIPAKVLSCTIDAVLGNTYRIIKVNLNTKTKDKSSFGVTTGSMLFFSKTVILN